jgi:hypothetical protein
VTYLTCPLSLNPIILHILATLNHSDSGSRASSLCCTRCNSTHITCSSLCSRLCISLYNSQCNSQCSNRSNSRCSSRCKASRCKASRWCTRRNSYRIRNRQPTSLLPSFGYFTVFSSISIFHLHDHYDSYGPPFHWRAVSFLYRYPLGNAPIPITTIW